MPQNQAQNRLIDYSTTENYSLKFNDYFLSFRDNPLDLFSTLSLEELGEAALLDRKETKFIFPEKSLPALLPGLESEYHLLEIEGRSSFDYLSVYYDTPDRVFYNQHQAGARPRWKIRQRTYLNTGLSFWEVKRKDNRNLTSKTRQRIKQPSDQVLIMSRLLEQAKYPERLVDLNPVLETRYTRITLIHKSRQERITLDCQLSFSDGVCSEPLSNLMVAEVKQNRLNLRSPFLIQLKQISIQPCRFSKYCLGSLLLDPTLKYNRFKPIILQIKSLPFKGRTHEWTL